MLINLWSTPRTGSNWCAKMLVKEYENSYSISELFNKNIYAYYFKEVHGDIFFLSTFTNGCYYIEYGLDSNGRITEDKIYMHRTRMPDEEELHRIQLVRSSDNKHTLILSNHTSPINSKIYDELYTMADRNIFLQRKDIKAQISSFCISYYTKKFITYSTTIIDAVTDISVPKVVIDNIVARILHSAQLDKPGAEFMEYESLPFEKYVIGMPKKQNLSSAFDLLSAETKELVEEAVRYTNLKIEHFKKDEFGVVKLAQKYDTARILALIGNVLTADFGKTNQLFITNKNGSIDDLYGGYGTYKNNEDAQLIQYTQDYNKINPLFAGTYLEEVIESVSRVIADHGLKLGRVRVLNMKERSCYSYHRDPDKYRFHIPLITNRGSFFIVSEKLYPLQEIGHLYRVKTSELHTAINASFDDRYHLIFDTYI